MEKKKEKLKIKKKRKRRREKKRMKYVNWKTNMRENAVFARLPWSMRKQRMMKQNHDLNQLGWRGKRVLLDPLLVQSLDMPDVRKPSHHKGLRGSLEEEHAANKTHLNFVQVHHFLGTAVHSHFFVELMKGHSLFLFHSA